MSATPGQPTLLRAVSRWQVVALASNDVIGSGVYLLPATAAAFLGAASPWAVLAAGALVLMIVLCFAEAGSMFDRPGGAYVYTREAFGQFVGFEVGWMSWIARLTSTASLSVGFAQAVTAVWDGAGTPVGRAAVIVGALVALTFINVAGVKHGARTAAILVVSKVLPLLILIGVGVFAIHWDRIFPVPAPDAEALGGAALLLLFPYAGSENTAAAAGEFKRPQRDVPFALVVTIVGVTALYTLIQLVSLGVVPGLATSRGCRAARSSRSRRCWSARCFCPRRRPKTRSQARSRSRRAVSSIWPAGAVPARAPSARGSDALPRRASSALRGPVPGLPRRASCELPPAEARA